MQYFYTNITSPIGIITIFASDKGLSSLHWNDVQKFKKSDNIIENKNHKILLESEKQLAEYFDGSRKSFSVPLDLIGTEFQVKVWHALLTIPYGETKSYIDIARQIGSPKAPRGVCSANRNNPVAIIVPCHRVIGASGKLTGFSGGLESKAYLLDLEKSNINRLKE